MKFSISGFFSDISNFFSFKNVLGIDIGTTSIKLVEVARVADNLLLQNYGILETKDYLVRGNEAIQTSALKIVEQDTIKLLKTILSEVKPKAKRVVASLPVFGAFVVPIEMPALSPQETSKAVGFQARQYIPIPPSEATINWVKIEDFENQSGQSYQRLLLTAIPNDLLTKYKNIFRAVGLTLSAVEIESQALIRAFTKPTDPITAIIDIGAASSSIAIAEKGILRYVGQTDYGGVSLTRSLSRTLDISATRAEELKRRRGLKGTGGEYELSTSLMPFLDVIIEECERVRGVYERTYGKKVEQVILTGGGAELPGVKSYFEDQIKLNFFDPQTLNYFKYPAELAPAAKSLNNQLSVALGLTLKVHSH